MQELLLTSAAIIFVYVTCWFVLAQLVRNNSIIDIAWGLGFVTVAAYWAFEREMSLFDSRFVLFLLILVWGVRLSLHIAYRNLGKPEDFRYQNFRKRWGKYQMLGAYLQVFILQGLIMGVLLMPVYVAFADPEPPAFPGVLHIIGLGIWLTGFVFEAVGDYQLLQFTSRPHNQGHIITTGLWKYTRHPNYFGESVLWWGIGLYCLPYENGWLALVTPIVVTYLLTQVSGIPMLEKKYDQHPEFKAYAARTPAFFPKFR